ncbi:hypothetical protein ACFO3U_00450 [Flavobacterium ponti]|jgi:hypothetical protein|uniref:Uncharacterized protein n=1 Tax=Flavobacterium ponti TaxID=665133 RepID=A0ABV9P2R5_9FLAO
MIKNFKFLKTLLLIAVPAFVIHFLIFQIPFLNEKQSTFYYSIPILYLLYFIFSKVTLFILDVIAQKSFENVGFTFLFLTSVQIGLSYLIIKPILESPGDNSVEKWNFFVIMFLFLAIEAFITIRILNKKH